VPPPHDHHSMNLLSLTHHMPVCFSESFPDSLFLAEFAKGTQPHATELGDQAKVSVAVGVLFHRKKDEKETCLLPFEALQRSSKRSAPNTV